MKSEPVNTSPARQALQSVDEAFLKRAKELLAIPSVSNRRTECHKALEYIADIVRAHPGLTIEYFERNGVHSLLAYAGLTRPKRFKVLLNGHVDVVPATEQQFHPRIEQNKLYGRGALDMKVAALVMTETFCELAPRVAYPIGLQIVTDEEPGGYDGAKYQFEQGVRSDLFLTGEQSATHIAVAAKGVCRTKVRFSGKSAHGAYLWRGQNAILRANAFIEKLLAIYPVPHEEVWATTVNVSRIETTSEPVFNRVPDEVEVHFDIRPIMEDPHFLSTESFAAFVASIDPGAQVTHINLERGHYVESSDPFLQQLIVAVKKAKGGPVKLLHRHGQSDIRLFTLDPHCTGLEFGLKGKDDHGDHEFVELSSIPVMARALQYFLINLT